MTQNRSKFLNILNPAQEYIFASSPSKYANNINLEMMRSMLNEQDSART